MNSKAIEHGVQMYQGLDSLWGGGGGGGGGLTPISVVIRAEGGGGVLAC